jgi:hypothetical protein
VVQVALGRCFMLRCIACIRGAAHALRCSVAALLFALHPIHTEAVTGVVGRAELISAFLCLLGLLALMSAIDQTATLPLWGQLGRVVGALVCAAAAMAAKETGFTILGAYVAYEVLAAALGPLPAAANCTASKGGAAPVMPGTPLPAPPAPPPTPGKKRGAPPKTPTKPPKRAAVPATGLGWQAAAAVSRVCATLALAAAYLAARRAIIGGDTLVHIYRKVENPLAFYPTRLQRLLSTFHQHWCYAALLVAPVHMSADWSYACVPPVESLADPRNAGTAALYGTLAALALAARPWRLARDERLRAPRVRAFIAAAFTVMPFVPAANVRCLA